MKLTAPSTKRWQYPFYVLYDTPVELSDILCGPLSRKFGDSALDNKNRKSSLSTREKSLNN